MTYFNSEIYLLKYIFFKMEKSSKKILYNIFDINNNINTEININRPTTHKNNFKLSINSINTNPNINKKSQPKRNDRNIINQKNKIKRENCFYSYNNFISNFPKKNNFDFQKENILLPETDDLNINDEQLYSHEFTDNFNSSSSSKRNSKNIFNENNYDDEIISKKYQEVKKLHRLFDENIQLKKEIKNLKDEIANIKNINEINSNLINNKSSKLNEINENSKKLKIKMNELYKTIKNNNYTISKLNEEKIYLEKELISTKKELINKNNKINDLNDKCRNLQLKINEDNTKTKYNIINIKTDKENNNKNNKKDNHENSYSNENSIRAKSEKKMAQINKKEIKIGDSIEKHRKNIKSEIKNKNKCKNTSNLKSLDSLEILENLETKDKVPSTPSFKSFKSPDSIKDENEELFEILNNNDELDKNKNNNENFDIKYYQNRYLYYFKLYQEIKKKNENLEKEKIEKDELIGKLKNDINSNIKNENSQCNNNLITTFSEIKLNYQYNPNEFFIICDKSYGELKWYLMKKQIDYEKNDTYDNLIWVPKVDVIDIDKFNEYSNEDEDYNLELLKVIKKLEEKENIISKLTYKIDKLEKDIEYYKDNSYFSDIYDEIFIKTNPKDKNKKKSKKS